MAIPLKRKPSPLAAAAAPKNPLLTQAQAEIQPWIDALTSSAQSQAAASDAAIKGLTDQYARQLGATDLGASYSPAISQQASVDDALRQALTGGGTDLASALAGRLSALEGSSGGAALAGAEGALSSQGAGAGNTRLAAGSAALGKLIGDQASARQYGATLPATARMAGINDLAQAQGIAQKAIAAGTQQAESQIPGIEQQIRSAKQAQAALKSENAYRSAELQQGQARIGIEQYNAATSRLRAAVAQRQGAERINIEAQRVAQEALNSNRSYSLRLQQLGIDQKKLQLQALKAQASLNSGGLSPDEIRKVQITANQIATDGAKHKANLGQIMHTMTVNDIPPTIAMKAAKVAGYKPGKPGMFTGLARMFAGGAAAAGGRGGKADYGQTQGIGPQVGQAAGGVFAHSTNAGGFLPHGQKFQYDRQDQGRDIQTAAGSPIIAPGDGYVVRIASDPGGGGAHFGPSYPIVHFTSGPYAGQDVYIGHTVAAMRAGQKFSVGEVLSRTQKSGPLNGGAPDGWAEIGFAPGGSPGRFDQPAPF